MVALKVGEQVFHQKHAGAFGGLADHRQVELRHLARLLPGRLPKPGGGQHLCER